MSRLTIGIAVPGYINHVKFLYPFLDAYEAGTEKPDKVAISLSSMPEEFVLTKSYSFPIQIIATPARQTAGKNRNVAKAALDTDIVSFMDIDDIAHPRRVEYIRRAFEMNPTVDVVLHNFVKREYFHEPMEDQDYLFFESVRCTDLFGSDKTKYGIVLPPTKHYRGIVMHSQPSIRQHVSKTYNVDESAAALYKEDLIFLKTLWNRKLKFGYIEARLSNYRPHC
jgi:hypothetical protein